MHTHSAKTDTASKANANQPAGIQGEQQASLESADQWPGTIDHRQLQELTDNSSQVKQFRALQAMADESVKQQPPIQQKENNTGLPQQVKAGVENLSGFSLDDVKVHYNSDKPAQLQAHAYAQGTDIHMGPGQEKHLPHEAWHVVQQKQGRVQPTVQMKGFVPVNDDAGLEKEADEMGAKALSPFKPGIDSPNLRPAVINNPVVQGNFDLAAGYNFAVVTRKKTYKENKVYGFTSDGNDFVIKEDANVAEAENSKLAKIGGLESPDMRVLTGAEATQLGAATAFGHSVAGWWLMPKMDGETLLDAAGEEDDGKLTFSDDQWKNIGKSAAHQVFVVGYDRWKLALAEMGEQYKTRTNLENTILADNGAITVIDTPSPPGVAAKSRQELSAMVTPFVTSVVGDPTGAALVRDVWGRDIGLRNVVNDHPQKGPLMQQGFVAFMTAVVNSQNPLLLNTQRFADMKAIVAAAMAPPPPPAARRKCYLTTACVEYMGLPDDCKELSLLRHFRDEYLLNQPGGYKLIKLYYEHAPAMVAAIHRRDDEEELLKRIYRIICDCVQAIEAGNNQYAFDIYCEMVIRLKEELLPEMEVELV